MAMKGDLPMITKGGAGIVDRVVMVCRSVVVDKLIFPIVIRVFLHTDFVQFGIRVLVVSDCNSFGQGINIDPVAM